MPLTEYQAQVARILASGRTPDSYLAGGAAMHIEPNSLRYSNALDYFNDSAARVSAAFDSDRAALGRAGHAVDTLIERPGFVRAIVRRGSDATKIEWVFDTAFRFLPVVADERAGYLLHPIDLAINKLLALVGRDEPRDYLDTVYAHEHVLALGGLVWAACGKDPGFTPELILDLLRRKGRYRPEDFARLRLSAAPNLPALKNSYGSRPWIKRRASSPGFLRRTLAASITIQDRKRSWALCLDRAPASGILAAPEASCLW